MRRHRALFGPCGCGRNHVREWSLQRNTAKSASFPFSQVVLHAPVARFSEKAPRLPPRTWHHRYFWKFLVRILRPVASAKSLDEPDNFPSLFKATSHERKVNQV